MALGGGTRKEPLMIQVGARNLFIQIAGWCLVSVRESLDMGRTVCSANNMLRGIQNEKSVEGLGPK